MKTNKITSSRYFIPITLFMLCFLLYGNTFQNDYAEDDGIYSKNEFIVKGFSAFKDIWDKGSLYGWDKTAYMQQYRPLTLLNIMTEVSMFGLNPHIGHFFNILFFAFTVVLLYFFLQKILKNNNRSVIIAASLLFAFHPIHTEVVANIKSRDEILAFLFGLISFYFIIGAQEPKWEGRFLNRPYIISLLAFFAALFCKESAITFLPIVALLLYFFTSIGLRKIGLRIIPFLILAGMYLVVRNQVLQNMTYTQPIPVSDNALMSAGNNADRIATSFVLIGKYIYMTLIPYPLSWDYSYNQIPIVSWGNIKAILSLLVCILLIGSAIWNFKRKSIFSFLILFFFITLSLSCNVIIKIAATFAERFLYVPSLAFCIGLPVFVVKSLELRAKSTNKVLTSKFLYLSFSCLLIVYALIVIPRNAEWKNDFTLFSSGVVTSPNSCKAHKLLAVIYQDMAQNSEIPATKLKYYSLAIDEFTKATKEKLVQLECLFGLGICYDGEGDENNAIIAYKNALLLKPDYSPALNNIGLIYLRRKQYDLALPYFLSSYNYAQDNSIALVNISVCYQFQGNNILALHYDSLVLKSAPDYIPSTLSDMAITFNELGVQYLRNNELDKALKAFSNSLSINPNIVAALRNIAMIYEKKGDKDMAKKYAQMAAEKDPNNSQNPNQ